MEQYELIVIGGGPGGCFSAITVGEKNKKVLLIEKNSNIGKKLLVAGQGRCNLTNKEELKNFLKKYGDKGKFLRTSLYSFTSENLIQWFYNNNLPLVLVEESGKYFPNTFKSSDVIELLEKKCKLAKVQIKKNCIVEEVKKIEDGFVIKTTDGAFKAKKLVISTGGKSYPGTGTTGDGYLFAKALGHKIIEPRPSLTPVYVDNYQFAELSGISFKDAKITLLRNNKMVAENRGDILLTHHNLSGPGIIDFSRYIRKEDLLKINFIGKSKEEFSSEILNFINSSGKLPLKAFLNRYKLPERFIKKIADLFSIDLDKKSSELKKEDREKIISLSDYGFRVTRVGDFSIAMATTGGVSTEEINPKTMESKIVKDLYFVGEVLDIDGDTGGYNIQAAFSTGYLAAQDIVKNL